MTYSKSMEVYERASSVTPGAAQTMSKRPDRFTLGAFPAFLSHGEGASVWDVDGNRYVDWVCSLGATPLGYDYSAVTEAVQAQLTTGLVSASLPTTLEYEVAEKITDIAHLKDSWDAQVRFVKTGSEACQAAARIARRYTGRDVVVVTGYHGWHDWVQAASPEHPGIPEDYKAGVRRVQHGATLGIEAALRDYDVAAVMIEAALFTPPAEGYLTWLREQCNRRGALLIFDETVMGFRWAVGGGSEYFGVEPDMAIYGKGLANGYPLACVVGPREVMAGADVVSGTFGGECLSLAAAKAVLNVYKDDWPIAQQWRWGGEFLHECNRLGIPVTGYAVHPRVMWAGASMARFLQETAKRGLLLHPGGFNVPAVLTDDEWIITANALAGAAEAMQRDVPLEGKEPEEGILRRIS